MNFIALIHLLAGIVTVAVSWPLIRRRVGDNFLYGFRLEAVFESDERWYNIGASGGKLLLRWGQTIIASSLIGLMLPEEYWIAYACVALVVILGGLSILVFATLRHADSRRMA